MTDNFDYTRRNRLRIVCQWFREHNAKAYMVLLD